MIIKVLGTGCANCKKLEANAKEAVKELGLEAVVEKVEDLQTIMSYGVMKTPALVVNDQVKVMGRVPSTADIKKYLN
ncbi:MAG: thioredoxin family protein [Desulfitobacterium sp.]